MRPQVRLMMWKSHIVYRVHQLEKKKVIIITKYFKGGKQ